MILLVILRKAWNHFVLCSKTPNCQDRYVAAGPRGGSNEFLTSHGQVMGPYVVLRCWVSGAAAVSVINELDIGCGKFEIQGDLSTSYPTSYPTSYQHHIDIISTPQWNRCCHSCIFSFQEIFLPECADAKEDPPEKAALQLQHFSEGQRLHPYQIDNVAGRFLVILSGAASACVSLPTRMPMAVWASILVHGLLDKESQIGLAINQVTG